MATKRADAAARRLFTMGVLPQKQSTQGTFFPAPVGGINTISPASAMPATDCLTLQNLIPFQYGLRVRSGYRDWFVGIRYTAQDGAETFDPIRTLIPFTGSAENGSLDRLFACTQHGIYDVTHQQDDITQLDPVPVFGSADGWVTNIRAGTGVFTAFTNANGEHFLAYTDGANGYLLYRESTDDWVKIAQTPSENWKAGKSYGLGHTVNNGGIAYIVTSAGTSQAPWVPLTAYVVGDKVANGDGLYRCTIAGTSAASGGPTGTTAAVVDGTVTWVYEDLSGPLGSGKAITDGTVTWAYYPSIYGANPGSFRFVMMWKNRLWFVPSNSTTSYYLDVRQFAGAAYALNFAPRFKYGGNLVGLWSWTLDGGTGIDDLLVGISRSGDVVVYQGTDPSMPGAFGLKGVWWVGPVPPGRTIASDFGGDLFILSMAGCLPLSKLVAGGLIRDPSVYETAKVSNLFNRLMSERGGIEGWALTQHPTDNLLVINIPGLANGPTQQLVMSLATKGWAEQINIPIRCMTTWHGALYFGTDDGRVCTNTGYYDSGVTATTSGGDDVYADAGPQEIDFALLTSYQNGGSSKKKRVHMARPYFMTDGTNPGYEVQARYDYSLTAIELIDVAPLVATPDAWDVGRWDSALWSDNIGIAGQQYGTVGMGTVVALVLRGTAITNTTFVGMDVMMDQGWLL